MRSSISTGCGSEPFIKFRSLSLPVLISCAFVLEFQFQRQLNLSWIEDIAWCTEAGDRRIVQIAAAVERGDVPDVNPVEEIEEINAEFAVQSFRKFYRSRDPRID